MQHRLQISYSPAVDSNRSILAKLVLSFLHMSDEFYEAFTRARDSLFRPVSELKLPYCSRLTVLHNDKQQRSSARQVTLHIWLGLLDYRVMDYWLNGLTNSPTARCIVKCNPC